MSGAVGLVIERIRARRRPGRCRAPVGPGAVDAGVLVEGDVFCINDPYGGGHPPERHEDGAARTSATAGSGATWRRSATSPTSVAPSPATTTPPRPSPTRRACCLPPVKLRRGGELDTDVVDIICSIGRSPTTAYGDLNGQLNALDLGVRRTRRAARRLRRRRGRRGDRGAVGPCRHADAQPPVRAARRHLARDRPPRQRRQLARADPARSWRCRSGDRAPPGLHRQLRRGHRSGQHLGHHRPGGLLRGAQAPVPRGARQRRMPRAGRASPCPRARSSQRSTPDRSAATPRPSCGSWT